MVDRRHASVGTGSTRTRSCASTRRRRSTASPRRCSARRHPAGRARGGSARARDGAGDLRVLRRACCASGWSTSGKVTFYPSCEYLGDGRVRVTRVREEVRGPRSPRASSTPATSRRRSRRGRPHPSGSRTGCASSPVNDLVELERRAVAVRGRRVRARPRPTPASGCSATESTPTRSAGCGPATRGCSTARGSSPNPAVFIGMAADIMEARGRGDVARRAVPPPGGSRRDAARRPVRDPDHGEDADARAVGARPAAHHRERRAARARQARRARPDWCSTRAR